MYTEASTSLGGERHPIEFTASGSEYFRIWIVNVLLIAVTLGIYLPWAKARMLSYFYRNTWVAGDALDFHGDPLKMLRGTLVAAALLVAYTIAREFSEVATVLSLVAFVVVWPAILRATLQFRLANTSWRGLRFRFVGSLGGAYAAIALPLALLLVPFGLFGAFATGESDSASGGIVKAALGALLGVGMVVFLFGFPYFLWKLKKYQHDNYVLGQIQTRMNGDVGVLYGLFIKAMALSFAAVLLGAAVVGSFFMAIRGSASIAAIVPGLLAFASVNVLIRTYLMVRLHNFWWSSTTAPEFSFESDLSVRRFFVLQLKNLVLLGLTLGLYWPFAVVAVRRAKLESLTIVTAIPLDRIQRAAGGDDPGATGEMAGELFGIDIGM